MSLSAIRGTFGAFALVLALAALPACFGTSDKLLTRSVRLGPYELDRRFVSMTGPSRRASILLDQGNETPRFWVRGFKVGVEGPEGQPESSEFLCHAWASVDTSNNRGEDLLTISQGLGEMNFPDGFAMKVPNSTPQPVMLFAQALNNNDHLKKTVYFKLELSFYTDEAARRLGLRELVSDTVATLRPEAPRHGKRAGAKRQITASMAGELGERESDPGGYPDDPMHFDVPPGRHEFRSRVPRLASFVRDGTIHFIKMHLHPYGKSVELYDVTEHRTVWKGFAQSAQVRPALLGTDHYSDSAGLRIHKDHVYEVVTTYDNTSGHVIDAMGVLRVYFAE